MISLNFKKFAFYHFLQLLTMLLKNENSRFEMIVIEYQYPGLHDSTYDSNWLVIAIQATTPYCSWSASDPCILTFELACFTDWLDALADGKNTSTRFGFFEPMLWFEVIESGPRRLRVYIDEELKPVRNNSDDSEEDEAISIEFDIIPAELKDSVASLQSYLRTFPIRADADKSLCSMSTVYLEID